MFSMKKILAIAGAGAMLVSVAACGSGTAGDDGGKKEISFQTWNLKNDKYTPYFEALIKAYEKDHPDVTVKWLDAPSDGYEDKLSSQAAAGELPDIVDGGNSILYGLAKAGALLDVSKQAPDAEKDYYEGAWKSVTMQGNGVEKGAYGLPWYVNDGPTYWNTELMQKCGLDPNKIPTTWDEYFAAGDTIVQNCKDVYLGTTMGYNAEDLMTAGVKSFMNDDHSKYTFNDEAGVKQISRFVELYKKGGIPPEALDSSWSQAADLFQRGNLVSMPGVRSTMMLIMMLSTIAAFRVFNEIYVLTNGSAGPGGMDMTMSMLIKREGTGIQARTGYASAISIVVLVIVGVMLIVQQIVQKRGED